MKKFLKITALFTTLCIILTGGIFASAEEKKYSKGDIITFGSYPQSKVTDESIIGELNKQKLEWIDVSDKIYITATDELTETVIYSYADTEHNDEKYRAIKYSDFVLENIKDFNSDTLWFKYDPIDWIVIEPESGYILCKSILDIGYFTKNVFSYPIYISQYQAYNGGLSLTEDQYIPASQWETSDIRKWLNNDFLNNSFTIHQQNSIIETTTKNEIYLENYQKKIVDTSDLIVLFSNSDIQDFYLGNSFYDFYYSPELSKESTDYSKYASLPLTILKQSEETWCIRSVIGYQDVPYCVYQQKENSFSPKDSTDNETITAFSCRVDCLQSIGPDEANGIVPAMHIDLLNFDKEAVILGDIDSDGKLTASDARLALRASVGLENLSDEAKKPADVDKNGKIEATDARLILRASVGLEDTSKW